LKRSSAVILKIGRKLSIDKTIDCINRYMSGETITAIAKYYGVSDCVVSSALRRNNIHIFSRNSRKSVTITQEMIDEYVNDKVAKGAVERVARKYRINRNTFATILKEQHIYRTPTNTAVILTSDQMATAIELLKTGMSYTNIGKELGNYSQWVMIKNFQAAGISRCKPDPSFETYVAEVRYYTEKNFTKFKKIINPSNLTRGRKNYHIDHIYSLYDGWKNNIPPNIISHPANLRMLDYKTNINKRTRSDMTISELYERVENFNTSL